MLYRVAGGGMWRKDPLESVKRDPLKTKLQKLLKTWKHSGNRKHSE